MIRTKALTPHMKRWNYSKPLEEKKKRYSTQKIYWAGRRYLINICSINELESHRFKGINGVMQLLDRHKTKVYLYTIISVEQSFPTKWSCLGKDKGSQSPLGQSPTAMSYDHRVLSKYYFPHVPWGEEQKETLHSDSTQAVTSLSVTRSAVAKCGSNHVQQVTTANVGQICQCGKAKGQVNNSGKYPHADNAASLEAFFSSKREWFTGWGVGGAEYKDSGRYKIAQRKKSKWFCSFLK